MHSLTDSSFVPLFVVIRWTRTIVQAVWRTCHLQRLSLKRTGETEVQMHRERCMSIQYSCRSLLILYLSIQIQNQNIMSSYLCHSCPLIHSWLSVLYCRCANCFDCPCCMHTLSTRATNIPAPLPDDPTKTTMKKAYYLACGFCRWTSRDVGMADKSVGGCWYNVDTIMGSYLQY